jgi:hypothetical protein
MKILARVLLSSVFAFLCVAGVAPLSAQTSLQCADLQKGFDFEVGTHDPQEAIEDLQRKVKKLEACLEEMQFNMSIHDPDLMENQIDDNRKTLITVESRLYETEAKLTKAEQTIEMLDLRLSALEPRAGRLKVPDRKLPPDFIPDTSGTTPHPASKKSHAGKPITPVNKSTPGKPAAPANKPTGAKEGTH